MRFFVGFVALLASTTGGFASIPKTDDHDLWDRLTTAMDVLSLPTDLAYDDEGRLTTNTRPSGASEQFGDNSLGYRIGFSNAELNVMGFGLDGQGRVTFIASVLSFDGVNDYVSMGDANAAEGLGAFTLAAWVNGRQSLSLGSICATRAFGFFPHST